MIPPAENIVAAHRGASRLAPENTMQSFERALALGAAALELDVHLTNDGELVVIHDAHVDRTTDGAGPVTAKSAAEMAQLDAGSWYSSDFAGAGVPTLDQVLELTAGRARVNIELKARWTGRVARRVIETVFRHHAADRVVVMSFDLDAVLAARHELSDPRWQNQSSAPVVLPIVTQPIPDPLGFVQAAGMDGLNYPPQLWDAELIQRFRDKGLLTHGGLINDAAALRRFFDDGGEQADSDDPALYGTTQG